jgi:hypothetical protein
MSFFISDASAQAYPAKPREEEPGWAGLLLPALILVALFLLVRRLMRRRRY